MIRCYVTDRREGDLLAHVSRAVRENVELIQVREKDLPANELFALVCRIRDLAAGTKTRILVNGRMDIAIAAGIDGVHLPTNGLPAAAVRPHVRVLGISTHTLEEAVRAENNGADFVVFGPIFETPGKSPVGLEALRRVTAAIRIPILAIGGITAENSGTVIAVGAAGIAAIRLFQN